MKKYNNGLFRKVKVGFKLIVNFDFTFSTISKQKNKYLTIQVRVPTPVPVFAVFYFLLFVMKC